ncbi:hypothetical protein HN51_052173, partial [Arachis hypogaea]
HPRGGLYSSRFPLLGAALSFSPSFPRRASLSLVRPFLSLHSPSSSKHNSCRLLHAQAGAVIVHAVVLKNRASDSVCQALHPADSFAAASVYALPSLTDFNICFDF